MLAVSGLESSPIYVVNNLTMENNMSRTVYILSDGGHNYDDAQRFGTIKFCNITVRNKDDISQMYRELKECLLYSDYEDLLLISSLTSLCCVATHILTELHGRVNFLLFHDGKYVERNLVYNDDQQENN